MINYQISDGRIVLTRNFLKKFIMSLDVICRGMKEDDLVEISLLDNTILMETDSVSTLIKLEKQE